MGICGRPGSQLRKEPVRMTAIAVSATSLAYRKSASARLIERTTTASVALLAGIAALAADEAVLQVRAECAAPVDAPVELPARGQFGPGHKVVPAEPAPGRERRAVQRRAWQWALANRRPDGSLPAGSEVARRFGRS